MKKLLLPFALFVFVILAYAPIAMAANPPDAADKPEQRTDQSRIDEILALRLKAHPTKAELDKVKTLVASLETDIRHREPDNDYYKSVVEDSYTPFNGSIKSLWFVLAFSDDINLPCSVFKNHPELISILNGKWGSNRDNFGPQTDCSYIKFPRSVLDYRDRTERLDTRGKGGSIRSFYYANNNANDVRMYVAPQLILDLKRTPKDKLWNGDKLIKMFQQNYPPLADWSYYSLWNRYIYEDLRRMFFVAQRDLVAYYEREFYLSDRDAHLVSNYILAEMSSHFDRTTLHASAVRKAIMRHEPNTALALIKRSDIKKIENIDNVVDDYRGAPEPLLMVSVEQPVIVKALLDKGADVNAKNAFSKTALMTAVQYNNIESVRLLLAAHADVDMATDTYSGGMIHKGRTALMYAAANASLDIIKLLLEAGADKMAHDSEKLSASDYLTGFKVMFGNPILKGADLEEAKKLLAI